MSPLGLLPPSAGLATGDADEILLGTGNSVPSGLEAIIEFNGVYLNNRSWIDTFVVTSIGGLDDADIRDDREVNPQQHGETAFDSFYGGRTITLTGYIRAFTLHKLRDMQQGLKQAFAGLKGETPMIFHTYGNPETDWYVNCRKAAPIQMTETQPVENWFRRDFLITMRASNPRFLSLLGKQTSVPLVVVDDFALDSSDSYDKVGAGATISGGKLTFSSLTTKRWIRNDQPFNFSDAEVVVKYEPDATFTNSLVRGVVRWKDSDNYLSAGVTASAGLLAIYKTEGGTATTLTTGPAVPARSGGNPYWLRVRAVGSTITVEHFDVDPRGDSPASGTSHSYLLAGSDAVNFGLGVQGEAGFQIFPGSTAWAIDNVSIGPRKLDDSIMSVVNEGNFEAEPIITMRGNMTNPAVTNQMTGEVLALTDSVPWNNPYTVNIGDRTFVDSNGVNKFSKLTIASDWPTLMPADNQIYLSAQDIEPHVSGGVWYLPSLTVLHHDTWN